MVVGSTGARSWLLWEGQRGTNEGGRVTPHTESRILLGGQLAGLTLTLCACLLDSGSLQKNYVFGLL